MSDRRVLVVDDNVDIANLTALLLQESGCEVATAMDGPSALETEATFRPHVVFLDINLPGMDGFEVASKLRERQGERELTIVLFSGYVDEATRQRASQVGIDAVLEKQGDVDALEQILLSYV